MAAESAMSRPLNKVIVAGLWAFYENGTLSLGITGNITKIEI